jgi:mRNA-degrading endonuclease toxin of MazEF toxin-antitoxin module
MTIKLTAGAQAKLLERVAAHAGPGGGLIGRGTVEGGRLVLSPEAFNRFGIKLACPVRRGGGFARGLAWTVSLSVAGLQTDGVVLCNQVRTLDWKARHAQFIEAVPPGLIADVLARVATLIE